MKLSAWFLDQCGITIVQNNLLGLFNTCHAMGHLKNEKPCSPGNADLT